MRLIATATEMKMLTKRSIEWLKEQGERKKRFYICLSRDQKLVNDPDFEDWIVSDSMKRVSVDWGENLIPDDRGFTYISGAFPRPKNPADPFPHLIPIYTRYSCSWDHVTGIYQGDGWLYIFTSKYKRRKKSGKSK